MAEAVDITCPSGVTVECSGKRVRFQSGSARAMRSLAFHLRTAAGQCEMQQSPEAMAVDARDAALAHFTRFLCWLSPDPYENPVLAHEVVAGYVPIEYARDAHRSMHEALDYAVQLSEGDRP